MDWLEATKRNTNIFQEKYDKNQNLNKLIVSYGQAKVVLDYIIHAVTYQKYRKEEPENWTEIALTLDYLVSLYHRFQNENRALVMQLRVIHNRIKNHRWSEALALSKDARKYVIEESKCVINEMKDNIMIMEGLLRE